MRKIVITYQHRAQSEQAKRNAHKHNNQRKYGKELKCSKCGKKLNTGETAYRTSRKYLCKTCGINSEI
jgi:DNA-directed RNA polymerase subunit RPC12/RpoP